jgi:hypothetical protein
MEQNIILPDASVLLVHRGWGLTKKKGMESTSINVKTKGVQSITMRQKKGDLPLDSITSSVKFEFVSMNQFSVDVPEKPKQRNNRGMKRIRQGSRVVTGNPSTMDKNNLFHTESYASKNKNEMRSMIKGSPGSSLQLSPTCSGSASPCYGGAFPIEMNEPVFSLMRFCKSVL